MKIAFLQDFFEDELVGGAEQNDSVLIDYLSDLGHHVVQVHTYMAHSVIECFDYFVVSNFVRMPQQTKQILTEQKKYIIYEHDHKYVANRNPAAYKDFMIPENHVINRDFYFNAQKVFVLSEVCKQVIEKNLNLDNVINIGCSLWSSSKIELIRANISTEKKWKFGLLNSNNEVKGTKQALEFCKQNNISLDSVAAISSPKYKNFIEQLSECETFIFFPQVLETYSRVCAEAKMLNCKLITTPKMLGFFSEDYSNLSGVDLADKIELQIYTALNKFANVIK
jgi:hypothetical protein